MWYSTHSTGIRQFDEDHQRIEDIIKSLTSANNTQEEKNLLMDLYCVIIAHIRSKQETPGFSLSPEERNRDTDFLRDIRIKIWERDNAHITQLKLIRDLRQMLADHVAHNNQMRKRPQNS